MPLIEGVQHVTFVFRSKHDLNRVVSGLNSAVVVVRSRFLPAARRSLWWPWARSLLAAMYSFALAPMDAFALAADHVLTGAQ